MNLYLKKLSLAGILMLTSTMSLTVKLAAQQPQPRRPNILVIMGDDVGWELTTRQVCPVFSNDCRIGHMVIASQMQGPEHVSLDRMVEFAVDWNLIFTNEESEHIKSCSACLNLFNRVIDERTGVSDKADSD